MTKLKNKYDMTTIETIQGIMQSPEWKNLKHNLSIELADLNETERLQILSGQSAAIGSFCLQNPATIGALRTLSPEERKELVRREIMRTTPGGELDLKKIKGVGSTDIKDYISTLLDACNMQSWESDYDLSFCQEINYDNDDRGFYMAMALMC